MSNKILTPRPYQAQGRSAVQRAWARGVQRPVVILPTAAGKTVLFVQIADEFLIENPGKRVVILAHTDELVGQAGAEVHGVAPHRSVGYVQGTRNDVDAEIVVASVRTVVQPHRLPQLRDVGLIIVDECHHGAADSWLAILRYFGVLGDEHADAKANGPSDVLALGVTATLSRGDRRALGRVWQEVVFMRDIEFMIANDYLVYPYGTSIEVPRLNLDAVKQFAGDYREGALGRELIATMAPEVAAQAYREHAADLYGVLFWPTVKTAEAAAAAMRREGFTCELIHGDMDPNYRRDIVRDLNAGNIQAVSNCFALTEGFNAPRLGCAVIGRATQNSGLYQQMVGRVLRTFPGKDSARILDLTGTGKQLTLNAVIQLDEGKLSRARGAELDDLGNEIPQRDRRGRAVWRGPTVAVEFDPLGDSYRHGWLTTEGGTRFLPVGYSYFVYLVPGVEPGTWSVAWCERNVHPDRFPTRHGMTEHVDLPLDLAVSWAQQLAGGDLAEITGRAANPMGKISRNGAITGKQRSHAASVGLSIRDVLKNRPDMRAGEFQTRIDTHHATTLVDALVREHAISQKG